MDIDKIKQQIRDNVKITTVVPPKTSGQSCGKITWTQRLYSEELDLTIETNYGGYPHKNRDLLLMLFEHALDEFIK
jgi:hypothetical protein